MITAQVVLINKEGFVLGVSRKTDHNDFGLPGGKMDPEDNNDPKMTAIRECKEETGLDITNLELIFAIHKGGNMGFTYMANYSGDISHNEPHVVKWVPFHILILGSFGKYNQLVSESLDSMGVKYVKVMPPSEKFIYCLDNVNLIHITSQTHWNKNKTKCNVLNNIFLDDLYSTIENSTINLHDVFSNGQERFIISKKDNSSVISLDETKTLLNNSGFIYDNDFEKYINGKNRI